MHLLPLLILPFFVAWRKSSLRDAYVGIVLLMCSVGWLFFAMHGSHDSRVVRAQTTGELLVYYASDPLAFFRVVTASMNNPDLSVFYQQSFIGILGWLDTRLPTVAYPALWAGLGVAALASLSFKELRRDWPVRLLLLGVALMSFGLIFLALLVSWTPHPASLVQGVQGRYFVVPVICLGYALNGFVATSDRSKIWSGRTVSLLFASLSLGFLVFTLLDRYR